MPEVVEPDVQENNASLLDINIVEQIEVEPYYALICSSVLSFRFESFACKLVYVAVLLR
jgi:hypothetical protein